MWPKRLPFELTIFIENNNNFYIDKNINFFMIINSLRSIKHLT